MKYTFLIIIIFFSCNGQPPPEKSAAVVSKIPMQAQAKDSIICPDGNVQYDLDSIPPNLISVNKSDEGVCGHWFPEDTVTPAGNYVKYLISNDSCCLSNLYVEWGNAKFKGTECLGDLRLMHPRIYPQFSAESTDYLFLESAASSGLPAVGWLLSLYPLHQGEKIHTYEIFGLGTFDLQSLTVLREIEKPTGKYFLEAYNIKTKRTKRIQFKNSLPIYFKDRGSPNDRDWGIDSISITPSIIFLRVNFEKENGHLIQEIVELKNDIW